MIDGRPLALAYGVGIDSTAVIVGMAARGIRPDIIMFANVGGEKAVTYDYLDVINPYLLSVGFPTVTIVRYVPRKFKHWPPYFTLEENCLTNGTLPSISFGFSSCSQKWKAAPQHKLMQTWPPALKAWAEGKRVLKAIGYDDSARDKKRRGKADRLVCTYKDVNAEFYDYWYPLQDWGWDRDRCKTEILTAGLSVPEKSSCFFCLAMKPDEVLALPLDKLRRIVLLEARAKPRLTTCEGLWRSTVKGKRKGTTPKPGSMTQFIVEQKLLSADEVYAIQQVPAELLAFQQVEAARSCGDRVPLGEYLNRHFPEMYPEPKLDLVAIQPMTEATDQFGLFEEAA